MYFLSNSRETTDTATCDGASGIQFPIYCETQTSCFTAEQNWQLQPLTNERVKQWGIRSKSPVWIVLSVWRQCWFDYHIPVYTHPRLPASDARHHKLQQQKETSHPRHCGVSVYTKESVFLRTGIMNMKSVAQAHRTQDQGLDAKGMAKERQNTFGFHKIVLRSSTMKRKATETVHNSSDLQTRWILYVQHFSPTNPQEVLFSQTFLEISHFAVESILSAKGHPRTNASFPLSFGFRSDEKEMGMDIFPGPSFQMCWGYQFLLERSFHIFLTRLT